MKGISTILTDKGWIYSLLIATTISCGQQPAQKEDSASLPPATQPASGHKTELLEDTATLSSPAVVRDTAPPPPIEQPKEKQVSSHRPTAKAEKPQKPNKSQKSSVYKYEKKTKDYKPYRPPSRREKKPQSLPHLVLKETIFHFDTVVAGDVVEHRFFFSNSGQAPLVFKNGYSTCGCTNPTFPREAVKPGQASYVYVSFNSRGKSGDQDAKVYFQTNESSSKEIVLHLKGYVKEKE